ncbi:UDP-glycosyltransferase 73B4 [Amborella trichopoda]|uniref:UDP-glycosyltransferase 73B4 n=1 Tax=Amborella trichopoda TaxID=13333 RepID=UPI0009BE5C99|nr:UDP-glycosyltransferase 73B4 [Amborella trichopoda]|eukprot:XP_006837995.2 UDP-glycosyltransferase 73B4 [Amborella trichopoda]
MENHLMKELALGLELSGQPFIWAVKPPVEYARGTEFESEWLPERFEDWVKEKKQGLIVRGWAPQLTILSHNSVGGFLSHCGWNSTVEALSQGVPIIGWPLGGDQFYNAKLLVEEVGVCVEIGRRREAGVGREEAARVVGEAMGGEKGAAARMTAALVREILKEAAEERG